MAGEKTPMKRAKLDPSLTSPSTSSSTTSSGSSVKGRKANVAAAAAAAAEAASASDAADTSSNSAGRRARPRKCGQACVFCRRSHMTCDPGRPCQRCIKRDIGHLCRDETAARPNHSRITGAAARGTPAKEESINADGKSLSPNLVRPSSSSSSSTSAQQQPQQHPTGSLSASAIINVLAGGQQDAINASSIHANSNGNPIMGIVTPGVQQTHQQSSHQHPPQQQQHGMPPFRAPVHPDLLQANAMLSASAASQPQLNWVASMLGGASFLGLGGGHPMGGAAGAGFGAIGDAAGGNEYSILSEFLESLDGTGALPTPAVPGEQGGASSSMTNGGGDGEQGAGSADGTTGANGAAHQFTAESTVGSQATHSLARNRRLSLVDAGYNALSGGSKTETFFLTAADQKDGTRDERLGRVIQAKLDAGLLRPYNHVKGYARLNQWMEQNCTQASRRRILKPLSIFRPAFRSVAQKLTNVDLIFIEEAFERLLLDYDRVFSTQGIPACLWRRTGEIYKGNKEFADLVGVDFASLRDGQCTIYELMQEESGVNYWEKYGAVCFDPGQKAVLTSCVLKSHEHKKKRIRSGTVTMGNSTPLPNGGAGSSTNGNTPAKSKAELDSAAAETGTKSGKSLNVSNGAGKADDADADQGGERLISCCFSFTIRRDAWGIPYAIVGNFLPLNR